MSNPNDPKPTDPTRPDPNDPGAKPDEGQPGGAERESTGRSSFEFELPDDLGSYSDLPPVPQPEGGSATNMSHGALPPRPTATRPATGTFDFIDLPDVDPTALSGSGVHKTVPPAPPAPEPPLFTSTDSVVLPASALPPIPGPPEPPLFTSTDSVVLPISALPPVPTAGDSAVVLGDELPTAEPLSSFTLSAEDLDLGTLPEAPAGPESSVGSVPDISTLYAAPAGPDSSMLPAPLALSDADFDEAPKVPAPESVVFDATPALADFQLPSDPPSSFLLGKDVPAAPAAPDSVGSFVLPALPVPPAPPMSFSDPSAPDFELPEVPAAEPASNGAAPDRPTGPTPDPEAVLGHQEPVDPVAPASGWLDSDVMSLPTAEPGVLVPTAEPTAGTFDPAPADPVESSDIFTGSRAFLALPVEQSDVISATAHPAAPPPVEPARPSDVALTFDAPPGGSTLNEGTDDMPIADEMGDSGDLLAVGETETESIHDLPDPASVDPLFDSARLVDAPDLPAAPVPAHPDDSTDYGSVPTYSADASSILADLNDVGPPVDADSSSVRVEAPGVDRTITGAHPDAFELTVSDEPIPADLFGASSDGLTAEATDWQSQSGSDLFAEGRTAPEIDIEADRTGGTVEPVDADLASDQPSLASAPSSIFSKTGLPSGADTGGSGSVNIGAPGPSSNLTDRTADADADAAEFGPHPTLNETEERGKDLPPAVPPKRRPSSGNFELPPEGAPAAAGGEGVIDWDAVPLAEDDNATRGIPQDASLSAIMRSLSDDSGETPARDAATRFPDEDQSGPVVTVDWMASSGEGTAITEAEAKGSTKPKDKTGDRKEKDKSKSAAKKADTRAPEVDPAEKPTRIKPVRAAVTDSAELATEGTGERTKPKPAKKGGGTLVGALLGGLLAGGAAAGVYLSGAIPNSEKAPPPVVKAPEGGAANPDPQGAQPPPAGAADPRSAFAAGGTARALELLNAKSAATTEEKAVAGYVRVFAKVQELGAKNAATAAPDDADLKAARADLEAVIADAAKNAESEKRAVAATVQLGVSYEVAGDPTKARKVFTDGVAKFPKHAAVFEALVERLDAARAPGTSFAPPVLTPEDARRLIFAATILLAEDAPKADDDPEPGLYYWKAVNQAAAGKYAEAIDLIGKAKAAHVKRAKAQAGRGLNPLTDPLEQMFARSCDELSAYWKLRDELYKNPAVAAAIKKDGVSKTLDAFLKTEKDLTTAKADLAKAQTETTKLAGDVKAAEKAKVEVEDKLKLATADLKTAADDLAAARKDAKDKGDLLAAIAAELKPAKVLPEKWVPADLVAGAKQAASLAGGADAQRLVKAETAAKEAKKAQEEAEKKLVAETKKLTDKYDADTKKLKDDGAAELKKLTDGYAADLKKLKDGNADELKKLTEKFVADAKKLADDNEAAVRKLKDAHETALKAERAKTDAEKKAAAAKEITFQKQLANAITPAQAMDLWLPVLTDLRRPADAPDALASAARALSSSVPGSEEEAKAHTVTGMGLLLKGDFPAARDQFQLARRGPTYAAAKVKGLAWAKAVDSGLDAIDDPLAPYRQPVVVPPVDPRAAAKALDAGIIAYKARRYGIAAAVLADAAKSDPSDPVAWYYLGAARWAMGNEEQAKKDFGQGAEREKVSAVPGRAVSAALAPIQGEIRDLIDKARP